MCFECPDFFEWSMPTRRAELQPDVESDHVWRDAGCQHYRVASVSNGVASLRRCLPAGRVLNQRHKKTASVESMRADCKLVSSA
jgi:hypothetical protein